MEIRMENITHPLYKIIRITQHTLYTHLCRVHIWIVQTEIEDMMRVDIRYGPRQMVWYSSVSDVLSVMQG